MKNMLIHFRKHFFPYILVLSIFVVGVISFYRIIIKQDHLVGYEGLCDPATESCFIGCEDDECTTEYYYSEIVKYAPDLKRECGNDITDCETANTCLPNDRECSVTYCDPEIDGDVCTVPIEEELLQGNDANITNI